MKSGKVIWIENEENNGISGVLFNGSPWLANSIIPRKNNIFFTWFKKKS